MGQLPALTSPPTAGEDSHTHAHAYRRVSAGDAAYRARSIGLTMGLYVFVGIMMLLNFVAWLGPTHWNRAQTVR